MGAVFSTCQKGANEEAETKRRKKAKDERNEEDMVKKELCRCLGETKCDGGM